MTEPDTKVGVRQKMLAARNQLSTQAIGQASAAIDETLRNLHPLQQAETIMAFAAFGSEVNLDAWISWALIKQQKKLLLPRINAFHHQLEAVEFTGWENCRSGPFGIREPSGKAFAVDKIEAVIVPGLAFDGHGHRIGYGKGYYDRFLSRFLKTTFLCGVCFEFQVIEKIHANSDDMAVHWIVTEQSEVAIDLGFF